MVIDVILLLFLLLCLQNSSYNGRKVTKKLYNRNFDAKFYLKEEEQQKKLRRWKEQNKTFSSLKLD